LLNRRVSVKLWNNKRINHFKVTFLIFDVWTSLITDLDRWLAKLLSNTSTPSLNCSFFWICFSNFFLRSLISFSLWGAFTIFESASSFLAWVDRKTVSSCSFSAGVLILRAYLCSTTNFLSYSAFWFNWSWLLVNYFILGSFPPFKPLVFYILTFYSYFFFIWIIFFNLSAFWASVLDTNTI